MTPKIKIHKGIRQGCPISLKLFILCMQILAYLIVNHSEIKVSYISQFADDTLFFLRDKSIIEKALNSIWFGFEFEQM